MGESGTNSILHGDALSLTSKRLAIDSGGVSGKTGLRGWPDASGMITRDELDRWEDQVWGTSAMRCFKMAFWFSHGNACNQCSRLGSAEHPPPALHSTQQGSRIADGCD